MLNLPSEVITYESFNYRPSPLQPIIDFMESVNNTPVVVMVILTETSWNMDRRETETRSWPYAFRMTQGKWGLERFRSTLDFYNERESYWPGDKEEWPEAGDPKILSTLLGVVGVIKDTSRDHDDVTLDILNKHARALIRGQLYPTSMVY